MGDSHEVSKKIKSRARRSVVQRYKGGFFPLSFSLDGGKLKKKGEKLHQMKLSSLVLSQLLKKIGGVTLH